MDSITAILKWIDHNELLLAFVSLPHGGSYSTENCCKPDHALLCIFPKPHTLHPASLVAFLSTLQFNPP